MAKAFPRLKAEQFDVVLRDVEKDSDFIQQMLKWFKKFYPEHYDKYASLHDAAREYNYLYESLCEFQKNMGNVIYAKKRQ